MADNDPAAPVEPGQEPQQPPAASQQPAGVPPDGGEPQVPDGLVPQAKFDEAIGTRQAAKERANKAEAELAEMKAKLAAMPDPEALKEFQAWKADGAAQARDKAMKDNDVEAIENGVRKPLQAQIESLKTTLTNRNAQLSSVLRGQALRAAATECGAHNPSQVVMLLRDRVRMTEQSDGNFVPEYLDAEGQPAFDGQSQRITDAKVFVELFLAQPENANLITSKAVPGSGATPAGGQQQTGDEVLPTTAEEFNALPPEKRAEVAAKLGAEGIKKILGVDQQQIEHTL